MPTLSFICPVCSSTFTKRSTYYERHIKKHGHDYEPKCSTKCVGIHNTKSKQVDCLQCGKTFSKSGANMRKSPLRHFCSRSCSNSYNNRHKKHGTRRSKLEQHLEEQIRECFPNLPCEYNSKSLIGSELDFYFPTLEIAIELNGILHYEPIYGQEKLDRIVENDKQKSMHCHELGIMLHTIDTSSCDTLTHSHKNKYWGVVKALLSSLVIRHAAL